MASGSQLACWQPALGGMSRLASAHQRAATGPTLSQAPAAAHMLQRGLRSWFLGQARPQDLGHLCSMLPGFRTHCRQRQRRRCRGQCAGSLLAECSSQRVAQHSTIGPRWGPHLSLGRQGRAGAAGLAAAAARRAGRLAGLQHVARVLRPGGGAARCSALRPLQGGCPAGLGVARHPPLAGPHSKGGRLPSSTSPAPTLAHSPASAQNVHFPVLSLQGRAPAVSQPPSSSSTPPAATAAVVMAVMLRMGGQSLQSRQTWRQPQLRRPKA